MPTGVHPRVEAALNLAAVWLDAHRDFVGLPGVSAGVVLGEELVWSSGFGLANVEGQTPATPDTIYSICSISKLFTAIACMQLRDQGKLSLSDPVVQHLEWFRLIETVEDQRPITIEMLLTHSAGLPREAADAPYWSPPDFKFPSRAEIVERLSGQTTLYESSTFWQYSNLGLSLVGEIVATLSGESFEDYVTDHILAPLNLTETRPYFPTSKHGSQMAIGYGAAARNGLRPTLPPFDTEGVCAAAGFTSTVNDLAKLAIWQHRTLNGTDISRVLGRSTLKEMHRVHWVDPSWETTWGLGYSVGKAVGFKGTVVGHGGACPGYSTQFSTVPDTGLAVIVMVNAPNTAAGIADSLLRLMSHALEEAKDAEIPVLRDLSDFTGIYSGQPWDSEAAVVQWMDELAMLPLSATAGLEVEKLQKVGGNAFRVIRPNDEGLGEEISFQRDSSGQVVSKMRHGQINLKLSAVPNRPVVPIATLPVSAAASTTTTVKHPDGTTTVVTTVGGSKL